MEKREDLILASVYYVLVAIKNYSEAYRPFLMAASS